MINRNTDGLKKYAETKNSETIKKVNDAIDRLKRSQTVNVNFSTVAKETGVSKATLYNNPALKERILSLRATTKGVTNTEFQSSSLRTESNGYLEEIRKLRQDKKNLILQLFETEILRDENEKLNAKLGKLLKGGHML